MKNEVKKNGRYSNGRQRWYCKKCNRSFSWKNKLIKQQREFVWFQKWVKEGFSVRNLESISKHSFRKIRYIKDCWLAFSPPLNKDKINICQYGIFDGTYLGRPGSIVILMDAKDHTVVKCSYPVRENSLTQIKAFLLPLKEKGLLLQSITVDGNPHVIRVFRELWPDITIQRCLVHIQRQGLMWCRAQPRMKLAKELRDIFLGVIYIRTDQEKELFIDGLLQWEERYGDAVNNFPSDHNVLSDLKRARSMVLKALPDMFPSLNDENIPFSTNGLEGYFSRVKWAYRNHRGMAKNKRTNYFNWYTYLKDK